MQLAILLYDGVTALDAIGPYEVLQAPGLGIDVRFVAREKGMKLTDFGRLGLMADYTLEETPRPDILLVPGTAYPQAVMGDPVVLEWIAQVHQTTKWTTSVCTGALGLAAAGVLQGLEATTHWLALDVLKQFGAIPMKERVVRHGKVFTAAGVSSGIDMASHPGCRRVRSRRGTNCPAPHRIRSATAVRCRQPRQGAAADRECRAR